MHGMLSDVTYQRLAGTNVLTDFVELPSQLFEHWLSEPEVLKKHVRKSAFNLRIPNSFSFYLDILEQRMILFFEYLTVIQRVFSLLSSTSNPCMQE